jgi:opacity protein-like surface antigen
MCDKRRIVATMLLFLATCALADEEAIQFKGYYKNLLIQSRTAFPQAENYTLDLNRLRLELRGRPVDSFGFEVQYDNEALLGSYLDTEQFAQLKAARPATYWDLEGDYVDQQSLFMRHRLHRGFVSLNTAVADAYLGRQRIAWGSGHMWNPTDLFNPYNPAQLEREERTGVDAVLVEKTFSALSRLSLAYAPQRNAPASRALRYRTNFANTDLALMAGEFRDSRVIGFEFAGRIGDAGVYGEAAYTRPAAAGAFTRAVLGAEYAFANTLTLGAEYYWNGEGTTQRSRYDFARLFAGEIQNVAKRYIGARLRYDLTPLLRSDNFLILNLDDSSRFFAPSLVYSLASNWDVAVGVQWFSGAADSEYERFHNVYYAYLQRFF